MYDFEIAVPSDTTRPQIKVRLEDFKKYGLLNTKDLRVHISFLATKNCGENTNFLKNDWPSNIDVDVIICPYSFTAQRIYNYYSKQHFRGYWGNNPEYCHNWWVTSPSNW